MVKTSILIVTRNRSLVLADCLKALVNQDLQPNEVLVIDNGSVDNTVKVCKMYEVNLPLKYFREKKIGIPFARNTALRRASGDILLFLDDDCISHPAWIKTIVETYCSNDDLDIILGISKNFFPKNIFASVWQAYYERWILENNLDLQSLQRLNKNSTFFDTRNLALRKKILKQYGLKFDEKSPFKKEDAIFHILIKKFPIKVAFQPQAIVFHRNPASFWNLMRGNYFHGRTTQDLFQRYSVKSRAIHSMVFLRKWLASCHEDIRAEKNLVLSFSYWLILFIYPLSFKLGRCVEKLFSIYSSKMFKQ